MKLKREILAESYKNLENSIRMYIYDEMLGNINIFRSKLRSGSVKEAENEMIEKHENVASWKPRGYNLST